MRITFFIFVFVLATTSYGQFIDSLVATRKTSNLPGKVPAYYTPGNEAIARSFQTLVQDAVTYYEKQFDKTFKLKLAVLDSSQWLSEVVPYGFVF